MPRLGLFKRGTGRSEGDNSATLKPPPDTRRKRIFGFSRSQDNVSTPNDGLRAPPAARPHSLSDSDHQNANPAFQKALEAYIRKLTPEEHAAFQNANVTFHSPETLIEKAKQSDEKHSQLSSSRKLASRFQNILKFLDQYLTTLAPCIQPGQEIPSLVVGGFKFVLKLALRFEEFSEKITRLLEVTADELSVLSKYATSEVFRSSEEVQEALVATYGDLLDLCKKIRGIFTDD